jgi:hypothetical protein
MRAIQVDNINDEVKGKIILQLLKNLKEAYKSAENEKKQEINQTILDLFKDYCYNNNFKIFIELGV